MLLAGFVSGLLSQIPPHQHLQQLITVDLADECAGTHVVGDIGGVLRQDITHDLVDGVITLFLQCLIDGGQDVVNFSVLFHRDTEFTGKIVHTDTTFLSLLRLIEYGTSILDF